MRFVSQSDADQLRRQSLQCSWISSLELTADGPQTAGLVIQPFQAVAEDIFSWCAGPKRSRNPPPLLNCV